MIEYMIDDQCCRVIVSVGKLINIVYLSTVDQLHSTISTLSSKQTDTSEMLQPVGRSQYAGQRIHQHSQRSVVLWVALPVVELSTYTHLLEPHSHRRDCSIPRVAINSHNGSSIIPVRLTKRPRGATGFQGLNSCIDMEGCWLNAVLRLNNYGAKVDASTVSMRLVAQSSNHIYHQEQLRRRCRYTQ